jgi:hypothetical protein
MIEALAIDPMQVQASCIAIAADLAELAPDYIADACEHIVLGTPSPLLSHLPPWLYQVRQARPERYLRLARQVLDAGGALECAALAATLWDPEGPPLDGADDLLAKTLAHRDSRVHREALFALHLLARSDPERATELSLTMELGRSAEVADRFAETFVAWHPAPGALSPSVWDELLEKLVPVEHLDIGSVYKLLGLASHTTPRGVVRMLHARIRRALGETSSYRPLPFLRPQSLVGFLHAPDHEQMLREIRDGFLQLPPAQAGWMPWLYCLASAGYGDAGLRVLREWIDGGDARGVLDACGLLGMAGPEFLMERADFVGILLEQADAAGVDVLEMVRTALYDVVGRAAAEGAAAGFAGTPWPPLVEIGEKGRVLSGDRGLHRRVREFYGELARLAEERLDDARNSDEERLL